MAKDFTNATNTKVSDVIYTLKVYTVATLPASPVQGEVVLCTDLVLPAFLATAVGGGAVIGPVVWNGSAWVSF